MAQPFRPTPLGRKLIGMLRHAVAADDGEMAALAYRLPIKTLGCEVPTTYTVYLTPDERGTFLVTCREIPDVVTFGEDEEEALTMAEQAIEEALTTRRASPD